MEGYPEATGAADAEEAPGANTPGLVADEVGAAETGTDVIGAIAVTDVVPTIEVAIERLPVLEAGSVPLPPAAGLGKARWAGVDD